jgi:hypothetical protein
LFSLLDSMLGPIKRMAKNNKILLIKFIAINYSKMGLKDSANILCFLINYSDRTILFCY